MLIPDICFSLVITLRVYSLINGELAGPSYFPLTGTVTIIVLDENDHCPVFESKQFTTTIKECDLAGPTTNLFELEATDKVHLITHIVAILGACYAPIQVT